MEREEALRLLKGGEEGIKKWNERREAGEEIPDLSGTDLSEANLSGVDLSEANLRGADLMLADLSEANLRGTDLGGAILTVASFWGARLNGTDFARASFCYTELGNTNLCDSKGLEEAIHTGPSTIGIDTLYRSGGKIPEGFLRDCGVPEPLIVQIPALINSASAIDFYSCFISHSHKDKPFARRLHADLQAKGIRCWLDEKRVLPGDDLMSEIDEGIKLWDKILLCCSAAALKESWWVEKELEKAAEKEERLKKERKKSVLALIPLDLDSYVFSDDCDSPYKTLITRRYVGAFNGWDTDNDKYESELEKLVKALRADDFAREPPPKPKL